MTKDIMKPPLLWIILCLVLSVGAPAANADDNAEVKAIVDKAIKTVGGEDKLLRLFRWKEQYYIGENKTGTIREAILQPPDHWWPDTIHITHPFIRSVFK